MDGSDQIANGPEKIHKMTPQQRQTQLGNEWYALRITAGGSNTRPARQQPELRYAHCARMEHDSTQRVNASQAGISTSQTQLPRKNCFTVLGTPSRILRFESGNVEEYTHSVHT